MLATNFFRFVIYIIGYLACLLQRIINLVFIETICYTQRIRSRSVGPGCFGGEDKISGPSAFPTIKQTVKVVPTLLCDGILGCGQWQRSD